VHRLIAAHRRRIEAAPDVGRGLGCGAYHQLLITRLLHAAAIAQNGFGSTQTRPWSRLQRSWL
jgi:hypothetical protein